MIFMTNNFVLICISRPDCAVRSGLVAPGLTEGLVGQWRAGQAWLAEKYSPHSHSHIFLIHSPEVRWEVGSTRPEMDK